MRRSGQLNWLVLLAIASAAGCQKGSIQTESSGTIDEAIVARVGALDVSRDTIQRIAAAQKVEPKAALSFAVEDALLAQHALGVSATLHAPVPHLERLALARVLMNQLGSEARALGPATDDEVKKASDRRWWQIDRPELFRVVHAVAQVEKPEDETKALKVAEAILQAVQGATDSEAFKEKAKAVDASGLKVRVEDLTPVAPDGRTVDPAKPPRPGDQTGQFDKDFAAAASKLKDKGELSPVVKTKFGYHVMFLIERIAPQQVPLEERRTMLQAEIWDERARDQLTKLLEPLRSAAKPVVEDQASALTGLIRVER